MKKAVATLIFLCLAASLICSTKLATNARLSLMAPYANRDDFQLLGNVKWAENSIVFGNHEPGKMGSIWSKQVNEAKDWSVETRIRVTGDDQSGEGLAFWYAEEAGMGNVFGGSDKWIGLAVIVDTLDNDKKGNNPAIMGILNDGTTSFNAASDGEGQYFGGCVRNVKNLDTPFHLRVRYLSGKLTVEIDDRREGGRYIQCFEKKIDLPLGYHFGMSAGTSTKDPDLFEVLDMKVSTGIAAAAGSAPNQEQRRAENVSDANNVQDASKKRGGPNQSSPNDHSKALQEIRSELSNLSKAINRNKRPEESIERLYSVLTDLDHKIEGLHSELEKLDHESFFDDIHELTSKIHHKISKVSANTDALSSHHSNMQFMNHSEDAVPGHSGGRSIFFYLMLVLLQVGIMMGCLSIKQRMEQRNRKYI